MSNTKDEVNNDNVLCENINSVEFSHLNNDMDKNIELNKSINFNGVF